MPISSGASGSSLRLKDGTNTIKYATTPVRKSLNVSSNTLNTSKTYLSPYARSPATSKTVAKRCSSPSVAILSPRPSISYSEKSELTVKQIGNSLVTTMKKQIVERTVSPLPPRYSSRIK